jgi:hypothetical protein
MLRSVNEDFGEMAEWSKAAASKAVVSLNDGTVGSNPTLSTSVCPAGYRWRSYFWRCHFLK